MAYVQGKMDRGAAVESLVLNYDIPSAKAEALLPEKDKSQVERLAYNTEEAAAALGIHRITLWRLVKRKLIKPSRALRTPLFPRSEIQRFLEDTK